MNKKHMVCILLLFAVLLLGISGAAIASDTQYDHYNLTIQPGTDENELSFTWFTTDPSGTHQLVICKKWMLRGGKFTRWADVYDADIEIVEVEAQSGGPGGGGPGGGGPGGGGPGGGDDDPIDTDEDGVLDEDDNCPNTANADQADADGDGVGDACDICPDTANEDQADMDDDGIGDVCDDTIYACKVTVSNVRNFTKYAYAVGNGENFSDIYYFDTKNPRNYNFIFVGDPQIGASRDAVSDAAGWTQTVTAALDRFDNASFILSAGDQVETSTSFGEYDGFFSAAELTSVPFAPTIGNHDTSNLYSYHFNVSNEIVPEGSTEPLGYTDGGGDYWFTYDKTLFMVLNTNNNSALSHSEFMAQAIEANPGAIWRVAVFHHSLYSSARHVSDVNDLRVSMYPVMDEHDIDVVLAGHDHFYARTHQLSGGLIAEGEEPEEADGVDLIGEVVGEEDLYYTRRGKVLNPSGTVYITANSASGSKYYDFTNIEGYTNLYLAAYEQLYTPTYLNVEVNRYTFTISAYRVDTGEMVDTYSILKTDYLEDGLLQLYQWITGDFWGDYGWGDDD